MSFTYNVSGIVASGTDYISAVRWLIDDTDSTAVEIQDEEITALYTATGVQFGTASAVNELRTVVTALDCAKRLHRKYAKQPTFSSAGTSIQHTERAIYWASIVQDLAGRVLMLVNGSPVLYAGRAPAWTTSDSVWRFIDEL